MNFLFQESESGVTLLKCFPGHPCYASPARRVQKLRAHLYHVEHRFQPSGHFGLHADSRGQWLPVFIFQTKFDENSIIWTAMFKDRVSREQAGKLMECGEDLDKLEEWGRKSPIAVSQLPMAIVGSGNSDLPAKFEGVCHSAKLDVSADPASLQRYCDSCVGFCSDFGTEAQMPQARQAWNRKPQVTTVREQFLISLSNVLSIKYLGPR